MSVTSLLSAAAASLAAVLAAINLYVLGRRERHQWLRTTLVSEYASYLDASFKATRKARDYATNLSEETVSESRSAVEREIEDLRSKQVETLTRLRLLATAEVVHAAEQILRADKAVIDLRSSSDDLPSDSQLETARQNAYARREDFIRAVRKSMKIPGTVGKVESVI